METMRQKMYTIISTICWVEDFGNIQTYGIKYHSLNEDDEVCIIENISTDFNFISNLVDLLNTQEVSLIHLYDVIEDFLENF